MTCKAAQAGRQPQKNEYTTQHTRVKRREVVMAAQKICFMDANFPVLFYMSCYGEHYNKQLIQFFLREKYIAKD